MNKREAQVQKTTTKKTKTRAPFRWTDLILFIVITLLVFFLPNIIILAKQQFFTSFLKPVRVAQIELATGPDSGNAQVFASNGSIIISTAKALEAYNVKGEQLWKRDLFGEDTRIYSGSQTMLLVEHKRGELVLLNNKNETLFTVKDVGPIERVIRKNDDYTAISLADKNEIRIYDKALKQVASIKVPNGQIVNTKFAHQESTLMVYSTQILGDTFQSYVLQYDMLGKVIASSDCRDMLIYDMQMYDNLVLVGNQKLYAFNSEAQLIDEMETPGYIDTSVAYKNRLILSILAKEGDAQGQNQLVVMNDSLATLKSIPLTTTLGAISVNDHFIATYSDSVITLIDHGYSEVAKIRSSIEPKEMIWLSDYLFLIHDDYKVMIYQIK